MMKSISAVIVALACFVATSEGTPAPVNVEVFYEALCPASKEFIAKSLGSLVDEKCFDDTKWSLVPYGNAELSNDGGFIRVKCQHGYLECQRNREQLCALRYLHGAHISSRDIAKSIICMQAHNDKDASPIDQCLNTTAPKIIHDVHHCASTYAGDEEVIQAYTKTKEARDKTYVPWVRMNGYHVDERKNIRELLCKASNNTSTECCKTHNWFSDAVDDVKAFFSNLFHPTTKSNPNKKSLKGETSHNDEVAQQ